jgi:hypothetical protein
LDERKEERAPVGMALSGVGEVSAGRMTLWQDGSKRAFLVVLPLPQGGASCVIVLAVLCGPSFALEEVEGRGTPNDSIF